jgi:inorganic pyrophosphatase
MLGAMLRVFIENEAGSSVKRHHDEKALTFLYEEAVSRPYPYPYGFVIGTTAPDGDNLDCFVLTKEHLATGQIVECEPIGLLEQFDGGIVDHNVLTILPGESCTLGSDVLEILREFIHHVFDHSDRELTTGSLLGVGAALDAVAASRDSQG